ncbi:MAG: hypothetical protein K9N49_04105, partial [Candidatus Marinimicrobia bacterium]|nr:hypothetical protein [Candidatus Neomarinimicrobiota bacterium]
GTRRSPQSGGAGPRPYLAAGRVIARDLLEQAPARRPEGLIVLDDFVAAGLMAVLREADGYRPRMVVLTHVQNPREYPLPVFRFELDIAELAQRGVAVLLERLRNPGLPDRLDRVAPRLTPPDEADDVRVRAGA